VATSQLLTKQPRITKTTLIAGVIEAVFIAAFAVTLFYGVNHSHPHTKQELETEQEVVTTETT